MKTLIEIAPGYEPVLQAAGLTDFDAFMRAPAGPPVGWHRHRETVPIDLPMDGQPKRFFLKRVFWVPPKHAFWPLFRGELGRSQPYREWHTLIALEQAGIPAMKRVAYGERRRFGMPSQAFLLVEAVAMQYTLENWLMPGFPKPAPIDKRMRDHLLYELGMLVRRLHEANFNWPDLGAKHIFAAPIGAPTDWRRWAFRLIDVERMRKSRATPKDPPVALFDRCPGIGQPLVQLDDDLLLPGDGWDLRRLVAGACLSDGVSFTPRGRDERLTPEDLVGFRVFNGPSIRLPHDYEQPAARRFIQDGAMIVDAQAALILTAAGLGDFESVFRYSSGNSMSKAGLASYRERIRVETTDGNGQPQVFFLKRYRHPPALEQIRRSREWRPHQSTAAREEHYLRKLALLGIPAPRTVAWGQSMRGRVELRSFIITGEVKGQSLERIAAAAEGDRSKSPSPRDRHEIIRQLGAITRRLHRNELYHRDLYLGHVFLTRNPDGGIVLNLIDLARMISHPLHKRRWAVKDLAALDYSSPSPLVTRADRLRFLYHYLDLAANVRRLQSGRPMWKQLARELIRRVRQRTQRMARHDAQRARRFQGAAQA